MWLVTGNADPCLGKMAALRHWEKPQTINELRSFMGYCNYCSGYVRMYADLSGPLHKMLQVGKFDGRKKKEEKIDMDNASQRSVRQVEGTTIGSIGSFLGGPGQLICAVHRRLRLCSGGSPRASPVR